MKYALSNIAFNPNEKIKVYSMLKKEGFTGLEIAPSLFLNNSRTPYDEQESNLLIAKKEAENFGLEIVSIQALLFGATGLSLFEDSDKRQNLLDYCKKAVDFAHILSIPNLVFGSPKNRIIPDDMNEDEALKIAIKFFKELGGYAYSKGACISIEANAKDYGGNFITKTTQAIELIKIVKSPGFKLNLDMGTVSLEKENIDVIEKSLPYTNHIHISEGFLRPIYDGNSEAHKEYGKIIKSKNYQGYVSIEMKSISDKDNIEHIKRAIEFVNKNYR